MLEEIKAYKKNQNPLQVRYVAYIKDTSIPLADRWKVFFEAPTDFKNHKSYIEHFASEKLLPNAEISWYDDFYVEKNETVDMFDMVVNMEEKEGEDGYSPEVIAAFKEEILKKNLGSFDYDW